MSKKSLLSLLLTAALGAGILTGCQGTASPSPTPASSAGKDSVVIAMDTNSEPAAGFDPAFGWGAGEHVHEPLIQSTLTVTKPDLTIGYDLATGYSVSDDGLTWTVTIRDDARFTDGEALTAEDVAFTYNTVKESSSVNDFTMLDRAEAVDETTVAFHMNTPFSIWPYTMAVVGIVPEHAYDSATYGQNPIGSGRYVLKQWDKGQQIILEANPDYYGEAPTIRRFTILFLEEDAAFLAVQAGQVDLAYTSATYSDQSVAGYSLTAYRTVDNRGFNLPAVPAGTNAQGQAIGNDFTSDVLVRRAINIGIDREEMIENVLNGYGTPAYSVCDQLPWYNPASQVEYDPEAAAGILAENGRRIVRALEVVELTGRPYSATLPRLEYVDPLTVQVGVDIDRPTLDARIEQRVEEMFAEGFVEEVEGLLARGLAQGRTAAMAIGYREVAAHLAGELDLAQAKERTVIATRRFARRQDSWFRKDDRITWVPFDAPDRVDLAVAAVRSLTDGHDG